MHVKKNKRCDVKTVIWMKTRDVPINTGGSEFDKPGGKTKVGKIATAKNAAILLRMLK